MMKKLIFILSFFITFSGFAINNQAMIDYIVNSSGGRTSRSDAQVIINTVTRVSKQYNFPESYIYGILEAESNFRNLKANRADARGVMQVTPGTSAAQVGCHGNLYNIEYNIECGVKYFDWMRRNAKHFGINNLSDLAAAYNCGPGCFKSGRWKRIKETTDYIKKVPTFGNRIAAKTGLAPLDMSQFPAGTGNNSNNGQQNGQVTENKFVIDLNSVLKEYVTGFDKGVENVAPDLIVILTFVFLISFLWDTIKNRVTNLEIFIINFVFELFKFVFFLTIINNFKEINKATMNLIFKVAEAFGSKLTSYYVLNEIVEYYAKNVGVLIMEFSKQTTGLNAVINIATLNMSIFIFLMLLIIYTTIIFTYIVFQVVRAVITYIIGANFSLVILPFYFSRSIGEYMPNPFSIFFKSIGLLLFSILIIAISLNIFDSLSKYLEESLKTATIRVGFVQVSAGLPAFDIMVLVTYAIAFTLVTFIMRKTLKNITTAI